MCLPPTNPAPNAMAVEGASEGSPGCESPALASAAFHGRSGALTHLLDKGATVSASTVCAAVRGGHEACVRAVCAHPSATAEVLSARGLMGFTPLALVRVRVRVRDGGRGCE